VHHASAEGKKKESVPSAEHPGRFHLPLAEVRANASHQGNVEKVHAVCRLSQKTIDCRKLLSLRVLWPCAVSSPTGMPLLQDCAIVALWM
jgi:hypothetical protein